MPSDTHNLMDRSPLRTHARHRRGQTAVVALLVLLLLAFVGALFITIIARNLRSQARSHRTLSADYYAEAGLRFADDQLTHSLDGADWRPPLLFAYATPPATFTARALARYNATFPVQGGVNTPQANTQDPDYSYLSQGFTRFDTENGRFLLRVTYDPITLSTTDSPNARYVKIESIGREGVVQADDPTTFTNAPASKLAATLVAYKPIGITDYARFETNIDNRNDTASLGVPSEYHTNGGTNDPTPSGIVTPGVFDFNISGGNATIPQYPVTTVYGQPDAYMVKTPVSATSNVIYPNPDAGASSLMAPNGYTAVSGGGSIRANMPLRLYGLNNAYLNRDVTTTAQDGIEVAGNLLLNDYLPNGTPAPPTATQNQAAIIANTNLSTVEPSALVINTADIVAGTKTAQHVAPSNGVGTVSGSPAGTNYDTYNGAVRDGGAGGSSSDAEGSPRSIARLDPPVIDAVSTATQLTRYQDITENSPNRTSYFGTAISDPKAGLDGYGQAIYVNNISDVQRDSSSLVGGHTLVDEWLNRNSGGQSSVTAKSGWQGPFYNPPGVDITFGLQHANVNGTASAFYGVRLTRSDVDPTGKPALWANPDGTPGASPTLIVPYSDMNASNIQDSTATGYNAGATNFNNDVIIYAEGNVRVRPSVISDPTGSTGTASDAYPRHVTLITNGTAYIEGSILKGNPDSSITILARDYVCLNTTQFYSGAIADENGQSAQTPRASVTDGTLLDFAADSDVLVQDFNFNPPTSPTTTALYVSGGPSAAGIASSQFDLINPATINMTTGNVLSLSGNEPFVTPVVAPTFNTTTGASAGAMGLTHITFSLGLPAGPLPLQLWTRRAPGQDEQVNPNVTVATQDYVQERSAILPGDIKIQAILYAQDKSFFVIPGPWFNSDTGDNLSAYNFSAPTRPGIEVYDAGNVNDRGDAGRFPFYGQPTDLKITIDGAVSEARPADISAQAAWMQKWGWIPQYHGSNLGQSVMVNGTAQAVPKETAGHTLADPNNSANTIPAVGLTLVYDPQAGYPFSNTGGASTYYLRSDAYGRPLPFTPKLPVSTGLLYAGQGDPRAVLP